MPIKKITLWCLAIPVPFDRVPEPSDVAVERLFRRFGPMEVLARGKQALHEEGGLDEITPIVKHAKDRHGLAGFAVHVVGPCAVVALGPLEEADDLCHALDSFLA